MTLVIEISLSQRLQGTLKSHWAAPHGDESFGWQRLGYTLFVVNLPVETRVNQHTIDAEFANIRMDDCSVTRHQPYGWEVFEGTKPTWLVEWENSSLKVYPCAKLTPMISGKC